MDLKSAFKGVPTPVLVGLGGGILGLGYIAYRSKGDTAPAETTDPGLVEATPVADSYDGSTYTSQVPSGIAYVGGSGAGGEDASSTVGAVGQTALDTVAGIATAAIGVLAKQPAQVDPDLVAAIAASQRPIAATIPLPQPPPPSTPAMPAVAAKETLPAGYHAGNSVSEAKYKKVFPGALGWARIGSGGKGAKHYVDYHVRFRKNKVQKWRYTPGASSKWKMIWHN